MVPTDLMISLGSSDAKEDVGVLGTLPFFVVDTSTSPKSIIFNSSWLCSVEIVNSVFCFFCWIMNSLTIFTEVDVSYLGLFCYLSWEIGVYWVDVERICSSASCNVFSVHWSWFINFSISGLGVWLYGVVFNSTLRFEMMLKGS